MTFAHRDWVLDNHPPPPPPIPCPTVYPERRTWYAGMKTDDPPVVTYNVPCGGTLRTCDICGQVRFCGREGRCLDDQVDTHWARRVFSIDDVYEPPLAGWTRGERWNGWACPRFERAEAERIAAQTAEDDRESAVTYEAATDTFTIRYLDDRADPESWPGVVIHTPEGDKTVYAIGAWGWIWDDGPVPDAGA